MRVAVATSTDVATVLRAPYARTLWTYYHLVQSDNMSALRNRSLALYSAGLVGFAFHEPKKLGEEHTRLMRDAKMVADPETSRAQALALVAEIEQVDAAGAWVAT